VRGQLPAEALAVAVVGSRRATAAAMARAEALAAQLARRDVVVISGGAVGIDAAAHRGALAAAGRTVAVLGTGIDQVYPDRHAALFDQIAERGALVSMFKDGTPPRPGNFVARNALIAGLSQAVVVVEAQLRSGSLSTARWARAQGRVVCAMRGSPGADSLLGSGAFAVRDAEDVLAALRGTAAPPPPLPALDDVQHRVLAAMSAHQPQDEDSLAEASGLTPRAVVRALSSLQVLGMVVAAPGRRYRRTSSPSAEPIERGSRGQHPS
jgi:DNA processing protein